MIDYLMVIVGVCINNVLLVSSSIKSVIVKDFLMVEKVVNDCEFVKYVDVIK